MISERTSEQQQRREQKRIGFNRPLNINHAGVETRLQRRQSHVDDRAVDKHHARSSDRAWCLTTVLSINTMLDPRIVAVRIQRSEDFGQGAAAAFERMTASSQGV